MTVRHIFADGSSAASLDNITVPYSDATTAAYMAILNTVNKEEERKEKEK